MIIESESVDARPSRRTASTSASTYASCAAHADVPRKNALAHHAGLDRTYVSGLERSRRDPKLDAIVKFVHS